TGRRASCGIVVESGEPREVHHFCLLLGFGASAVHPYLALETAADEDKYIAAICKGILKVMSKMGISTLQSYCGAQIFEAVGLAPDLVDRYFTGVPSRIGGIGLDVVAEEVERRHEPAYRRRHPADESLLERDVGGMYQWRARGERHVLNPTTVAKLQRAVRSRSADDYATYALNVNRQTGGLTTIRGLLEFHRGSRGSIPLEEVEPWTSIVRRFKTGAMSYGSISQEAHETLAIAMNRIGGKSNTGEGGEQPDRYSRKSPRRSRIKQVASGRFGVTIDYLTSADEIQIKMAQGAKPGEGGQLPGSKVLPWIAETRNSTPYVGLISPPPHHDIYSIEDLAQLIFDLKNANPEARVSVKLVSEVGVGTISAGVAKAKADVVLISGHDGGTGAAPATSVMHTGLPWELGLSETHQTLIRSGLRRRIKIECDGQLKTGRDVAVAALLGADEFGFATAPLVAMGCVMMRKCHLNTCPVGIATQDPTLRQRFAGQPEHVVNFFYYVVSELREIMALLGFRSLDEMIGRVDCLRPRTDVDHWKAKHLDLSPVLAVPVVPDLLVDFDTDDHGIDLDDIADNALIETAEAAIAGEGLVRIETTVTNRDRAFGTRLSHEISRRRGQDTLRDDVITIDATGSVGQSCGAFLAKGVTIRITGEANDYFGKGLSGGRLIVAPPENRGFIPNMNIIVGNVALYGATGGEVFVRGQAGERFAVRNSGASAVVEGIGDHGCEYMTGGRVVILGPTGRNFAAGMSGGIAYVMDGTDEFANGRCNTGMVDILSVTEPEDLSELLALIELHLALTNSDVARWVVDNWAIARHDFVKVYPIEFRLALERLAAEQSAIGNENQTAA
ncbi:MAG: glutamate synthase-related protein, partial [Rhodothermia bacterium]